MVRSVNAIVLKSNRTKESVLFYTTLGLNLAEEKHGDGPVHFTCSLQGLHFGIYELDPWKEEERRARGQETMIGFEVDSLDDTVKKLSDIGAKVVIAPEEVPWGRRAVVLDPDGRPVEINQSTTTP